MFFDMFIENSVICKPTMYDIDLSKPNLHKTIWPSTLCVRLLYSFQGGYDIIWKLDTDIYDLLITNLHY